MVYDWSKLSNMSAETVETPRYPLETLVGSGGDCEDTPFGWPVWIKAAPVDWYVDLVMSIPRHQ